MVDFIDNSSYFVRMHAGIYISIAFSYAIATLNQSLSENMSTWNSEYPMPSNGLVPGYRRKKK